MEGAPQRRSLGIVAGSLLGLFAVGWTLEHSERFAKAAASLQEPTVPSYLLRYGATGEILRGHVARPNPLARAALADDQRAVAVFSGPQAYVSPSFYPSKRAHGKVVPTWNYVAIHAYGTATTFEDVGALRAHLGALTDRHESSSAVPWKIDDAPSDFIDGNCRAIIGIEIPLSRIEGKWKVSQNRPIRDRLGVINGLRAQGSETKLTMAELVEAAMDEGGD